MNRSSRLLFSVGPLLGCAWLAGSGCGAVSGSAGAPFPDPEGRELALDAEWHDVDAALAHAEVRHELATLRVDRRRDDQRIYELIDPRDAPVLIRFTRLEPAPEDVLAPIELEVQYGRFGDEAKERDIIETLQRRLRRLERVD